MIFVNGARRCVDLETASAIAKTLRETPKYGYAAQNDSAANKSSTSLTEDFFKHHITHTLFNPTRTLLVGVFQNQPLGYILEVVQKVGLDIVQLHGQEPLEWAKLIPVPVIHVFKPNQAGLATRGYHVAPLLDAGSGGTGSSLALADVLKVLNGGTSVLLAGGLSPDNVKGIVEMLGGRENGLGCVDVSSGVETDGKQDLEKIARFIKEAKGL